MHVKEAPSSEKKKVRLELQKEEVFTLNRIFSDFREGFEED